MNFHFSGYWYNWSRVLDDSRGWFVEVNLTVIPHSNHTWENDVAPIRIRRHCTPRGRFDIETDILPDEVYDLMIEHLHLHLIQRLLHEDFMPQIDWDKYNSVCNGGANLADIRKEILNV